MVVLRLSLANSERFLSRTACMDHIVAFYARFQHLALLWGSIAALLAGFLVLLFIQMIQKKPPEQP